MKHIPSFYLEDNEIKDNKIIIKNTEIIDKLTHVLRARTGDLIYIIDINTNKKILSAAAEINKKECIFVVKDISLIKPKTHIKITLAQAIPKSGKIEEILKANTELGVEKFILFSANYSQLKTIDLLKKKYRLEKILKEASLQSERYSIPHIEFYKNLDEVILKNSIRNILLLHSREDANSKHIKDIAIENDMILICGPEGGFSEDEINFAKTKNASIVFLPTNILRCEHAAFSAISYLIYKS